MGDEFKTGAAAGIEAQRRSARSALATIEILSDSKVVETFKPGKREYKGNWTDPKPKPGMHYYYVRVQQDDGELAWASPMWIDLAK